MTVWQADFYRRPLQDEEGNPLWELAVCNSTLQFKFSLFCVQPEATADRLIQYLRQAADQAGYLPRVIQVFRPQTANLMALACQTLGIALEKTRRTSALKQWLQEQATEFPEMANYTGQVYEPVNLEQPPPLPLPENLWGERWRFGAIAAGELEILFRHKPIPVKTMPAEWLPLNLNLASTTAISGVIIDGGRQSLQLARWLQSVDPVALHYIPGRPNGLVLEAGLVDRWIIATFDDLEVSVAAQSYQTRLLNSQGLHFLLVQPDDSGMTYSGFWLLQDAS
jgi:hypothetical protein